MIANVQVSNITSTSGTITWTTDVAADSFVDYGIDVGLGSTESDAALVTSHALTLNGLIANTEYFFLVQSTGEGGTTTDDNGGTLYSFVTADLMTFSNIQVSEITATSATISWDHMHPASRGTVALSVAGVWYSASFGTLSADTWYHY